MTNNDITIRLATPDDAAALLAIYAPYVAETAITFELEPPTLEEFRGRVEKILQRFPYLVAVDTSAASGGRVHHILGYCYANTFRPRHAYDHCVEMSVYIDKECRRGGIGTMLYEELQRRLAAMGIINLCASITLCGHPTQYVDDQSIRFHEKHGFTKVAHFHKCGHKFDDWFDMIWMEKFIGEHE